MSVTLDAPRISAPASLVFENFLDVHSWHTWSQSIVNVKVANLEQLASSMDPLILGTLQKIPGEQHGDPIAFDRLHPALEKGTKVTLNTMENPRQPQRMTTVRLVVTEITYPLMHPKRKKISILKVPASSKSSPSLDNLRQRKPSKPEQPTTGQGRNVRTQTPQRSASPVLSFADQFPTSYTITYRIEQEPQKARRSSFGRWFSSGPSPERSISSTSKTYAHIITPITPTSCYFATVQPVYVQKDSAQTPQRKFFDYKPRFNFIPRRLSEPTPSFSSCSPTSMPATTQVINPNLMPPSPRSSSPPQPRWVTSLPRELGGHCVRRFSDEKLKPKLMEKIQHRRQRSHTSSSLSNSHPDNNNNNNNVNINSKIVTVPDPQPPLVRFPSLSAQYHHDGDIANTTQNGVGALPRSDSSAVDLSIQAQDGCDDYYDDDDAESVCWTGVGSVAVF